MKIVVAADDHRWEALRVTAPNVEWKRAEGNFEADESVNAFFYLLDNCAAVNYPKTAKPVFINSVETTLLETNAPPNVIRMNGWKGFIEKPLWELSGVISPEISNVLDTFQKQYILVPDEPGLVSARIIAMIINEAFFAKGEEVSSEADIDTAMKLGTNYPRGPFEWGRHIGLKNVVALLNKLARTDSRYSVAPALEIEASR